MRVVKKPEERRAEMVEAAGKLFVAQGFVHTSVAEIVAAVDVAKGLFYYYFTSKDDMVKAVVEGYCAHVEERMGAIAQRDLTGREKLDAVLCSPVWQEIEKTPLFADLCIEQHATLYTDAVTRITAHIASPLGAICTEVMEQQNMDATYAEERVEVLFHGFAQLARKGELTRDKAQAMTYAMLGL